MDAKADLVATAGYGTRQGRVVAETHVKVPANAKPADVPLPALLWDSRLPLASSIDMASIHIKIIYFVYLLNTFNIFNISTAVRLGV
jgi:hypothetical protein